MKLYSCLLAVVMAVLLVVFTACGKKTDDNTPNAGDQTTVEQTAVQTTEAEASETPEVTEPLEYDDSYETEIPYVEETDEPYFETQPEIQEEESLGVPEEVTAAPTSSQETARPIPEELYEITVSDETIAVPETKAETEKPVEQTAAATTAKQNGILLPMIPFEDMD